MTLTRTANAEWKGDLKEGEGTISSQSSTLDRASYTFASRFKEGAGTNPDELLAAAEAGCFTMALSHALSEAGHTPESVETEATFHMDPEEGNHRIELATTGRVPGIDEGTFQKFATDAKENCHISKALRAVDITLEAKLTE